MSEERRKRQQERVATSAPTLETPSWKLLIWGGIALLFALARKIPIWVGIVVLLALAYAGFWYHNNHRYDGFAKCLASKQVKMYGLFDCPHCADQKAMFGAAFHYVPYVECRNRATRELEPVCKAAGAKLFPSWEFAGNPPVPGVFPLQELSDKTGCSLP